VVAVRAPVAAVVAAAAAPAGAGVDEERTNMKNAMDLLRRVRRHLAGIAMLAATVQFAATALAQATYPTPDAAADAFVDSVARHDRAALQKVIGADYRKYLPHANAEDVTNFLEAWAKSHRIVAAGGAKAYLEVGRNGWTLPIPLVKSASGWSFDTKAAPDELRTRRIGRNELAAIQVVLACSDAQEDYYRFDRDRSSSKEYAQKILSTPGKRDGLYWPARPGEPESPLGSEVAKVKAGEKGYHGYHYKVLTAQGKDAPGGAKSYVAGGRMTGGFAFVAWPVKWGDSGVMTFVVDKAGTVHQKDLGPGTDAIARAMTAYNPDSTWTRVAD
jgi:hypothetical protein